MQHPLSGICPSSSWQELQLEDKGRNWHKKGEGGTDVERLVGSGCLHHLQGKMTQKATPLVLNCAFSDGLSANSQFKKNSKGVFQVNRKKLKGNYFVVTVILTAAEY